MHHCRPSSCQLLDLLLAFAQLPQRIFHLTGKSERPSVQEQLWYCKTNYEIPIYRLGLCRQNQNRAPTDFRSPTSSRPSRLPQRSVSMRSKASRSSESCVQNRVRVSQCSFRGFEGRSSFRFNSATKSGVFSPGSSKTKVLQILGVLVNTWTPLVCSIKTKLKSIESRNPPTQLKPEMANGRICLQVANPT